jgi:hypothetical protein
MAKRMAKAGTDISVQASEPVKLSAKITNQINALRPTFMGYAAEFGALDVKRNELAPKFMRAFHAWQAEAKGSFIAFVRLLDPSVPAERDGYRANTVYKAADYLRTKAAQLERAPLSPVERSQRIANAPMPLDRVLASTFKAIMPLVGPDAMAAIYKALTLRHWTDRQVERIKALVESEPAPLVRLKAPKGLDIEATLTVTQVPVKEAETQTAIAS